MSKIIRITVVGDGYTGKTSLLIAYKDKQFQRDYIPTVFDAYSMDVPINGIMHQVILQDTAGQEDFDTLRKMAYKDTDIFILCYSCDSLDSFENAKMKWAPEIKKAKPKAKIILAGTKRDLRETKVVSREQGQTLSKEIKAWAFIENSSKKLINVDQTFELALITYATKRRHSSCIIS